MYVPWQGGFCEGACPQPELVELWSQFLDLLCQLCLDETIRQDAITGIVHDINCPENDYPIISYSSRIGIVSTLRSDMTESQWGWLS